MVEIAKHYGKTVDEITHSNLTGLEKINFDAAFMDKLFESYDVIYPYVVQRDDGSLVLKRTLLDCDNNTVKKEARELIYNMPEMFE